tara:strand:+ start:674 stop:1042 length:369 start_codon:yes stop_codon:yes gene_type:complete
VNKKSMNNPEKTNVKDALPTIDKGELINDTSTKKGPLSFFSGALTSLLFAWICLILSRNVVLYFTIHTNNYSSPIAESVASGFRTLVIGMCFLATFTFGFIGLGLVIVFIQSLFRVKHQVPK